MTLKKHGNSVRKLLKIQFGVLAWMIALGSYPAMADPVSYSFVFSSVSQTQQGLKINNTTTSLSQPVFSVIGLLSFLAASNLPTADTITGIPGLTGGQMIHVSVTLPAGAQSTAVLQACLTDALLAQSNSVKYTFSIRVNYLNSLPPNYAVYGIVGAQNTSTPYSVTFGDQPFMGTNVSSVLWLSPDYLAGVDCAVTSGTTKY